MLLLYRSDNFFAEIDPHKLMNLSGLTSETFFPIIRSMQEKGYVTMHNNRIKITNSGIDLAEERSTASLTTDLRDKRINFLMRLARAGITIGENMYALGKDLGLDKQQVDDIVNYYVHRKVVEFPILGHYVKLVDDWYNVLNERDRTILLNNFLVTLHKESQINPLTQDFSSKEIFEKTGIKSVSLRMVDMILIVLWTKGLINLSSDHDKVSITNEGIKTSKFIQQ